jgi:hypothetical protein
MYATRAGLHKAVSRDCLNTQLSDAVLSLLIHLVIVVLSLSDPDTVLLGGCEALWRKCLRENICVLVSCSATELATWSDGVTGHKLAGHNHIMHTRVALPGQAMKFLDQYRMLGCGGVCCQPFL